MALYTVEKHIQKSDCWYTHWTASSLEDAVREYRQVKSYARCNVRISKQITDYNYETLYERSYSEEPE